MIEGVTGLKQGIANERQRHKIANVTAEVLQSVIEKPEGRQAVKRLHHSATLNTCPRMLKGVAISST